MSKKFKNVDALTMLCLFYDEDQKVTASAQVASVV